MTLPASSAECERGFSAMKLVKTDSRNKLTTSALTDVLRINLLSPPIGEFDPTKAIHKWNSLAFRSRRPGQKASLQSQLTENLMCASASASAGSATAAASTSKEHAILESESETDADSDFSEMDFSESDGHESHSDSEEL